MVFHIIPVFTLCFVLALYSIDIVLVDYTLCIQVFVAHSPHGSFKAEPLPLDPQYVTGFVDAAGCFHISLRRDPKMKNGRGGVVVAILSIELHAKDLYQRLLEHIAGNKSNKALQRGVKKYG